MLTIKRGQKSPPTSYLEHSLTTLGDIEPFTSQLLKWVGNKQRFAHEIISYFPQHFGTYFEPFLGSGAVLGTLAPSKGVASDNFADLIGIWKLLKNSPDKLKHAYRERWSLIEKLGHIPAYDYVRDRYNRSPNPEDLLFLSRVCYGGVVRFRKKDGGMSTPCGAHKPMLPIKFFERVDEWAERVKHSEFFHCDYRDTMKLAKRGDVVYCDPPYVDSQKILYGAQSFKLSELFLEIERCRSRGVHVALSIDGSKKLGDKLYELAIPHGLFKREALVNCGRSMLKRFQMNGFSLENDVVKDRLLLTY